MSASLSYPGVYVVEVPSGVRTITGVATSITAFIGRARQGPVNRATRVQSFAEYTRLFGDLWQSSTMGYAVQQFFQHGGKDAYIVRVFRSVDANNVDLPIADSTATITLAAGANSIVLEASSPGAWGANLQAVVDYATSDPGDADLFNLRIELLDEPGGTRVAFEQFRNLSINPDDANFFDATRLETISSYVRLRTPDPAGGRPNLTDAVANRGIAAGGDDGDEINDVAILGVEDDRTGMRALDAVDLFNLLCIPPPTFAIDILDATWGTAAAYCQTRRAMLIVDSPAAWTVNPANAVTAAEAGVNAVRGQIGNAVAINAAAYFPRLRMADPLDSDRLIDFPPCGAVAGIMARTDATRGVWKAPAGLEASLSGVREFTYTLNDDQNGRLNILGLNCLRNFTQGGNVVWGARTLAGSDALASEWKYVPVRRLALFLEESLYRGTQWVVFEPNDEPLWAQIRLNVGAFMHNLFRKGAFQGTSPRDAYYVKCDSETTLQNDIDLGIVNIEVGFAPLKPAEFVVLRVQQIAGEIQT